MNSDRLVAGLDIGSAKTTAIIAEVVGDLPKHPSIRVLGVGQARTTGMRRGVVSDIEETTRSIRKALQDAERMAGATITDVYTGIAGDEPIVTRYISVSSRVPLIPIGSRIPVSLSTVYSWGMACSSSRS